MGYSIPPRFVPYDHRQIPPSQPLPHFAYPPRPYSTQIPGPYSTHIPGPFSAHIPGPYSAHTPGPYTTHIPPTNHLNTDPEDVEDDGEEDDFTGQSEYDEYVRQILEKVDEDAASRQSATSVYLPGRYY